MASYIKLYGPSISKGLEKLEELVKKLELAGKETISPEQTKVTVEPIWARGGDISFERSRTISGKYDFMIDWKRRPTVEQIKGLIKLIDEALERTGCRYTVTTL
jgi:Ser-tRNA(Ala) deacylase AlaX